MKEIKIGALLSYLGILFSIIVMFIYTPILIKYLTKEEYAIYVLVSSIAVYLSILDLGLGNAIIRYIAREKGNASKISEYIGMFITIYTILGIVVLFIGLFIASKFEVVFGGNYIENEIKNAQILMLIITLNSAISFPLGVFAAVIQAHEKFIFIKSLNILKILLPPLLIIPLLFIGYGSIIVILLTSIINVCILIFNIIYVIKRLNIKIKFGKIITSETKEIFQYSFFIFITAIIDKIYWSTDQIILGMVSSPKQVAIYAVSMQLIGLYMTIATVINSLYLPKLSLMEKNNYSEVSFSNVFLKIGGIQSIIILYFIGGFIHIGENFINLWLGKDFKDIYYIMLCLFPSLAVIWSQTIGVSILQARNKHIFRSILYLIIAIINIVVSIPIAANYGGIGTAIITSLCLLIGHIFIMNLYYQIIVKLDMGKFWITFLKNSLLLGFVLFLSKLIKLFIFSYESWLNLVINIIIFSLLYLLIFMLFSVDKKKQKQIINTLRERII